MIELTKKQNAWKTIKISAYNSCDFKQTGLLKCAEHAQRQAVSSGNRGALYFVFINFKQNTKKANTKLNILSTDC